MRTKQIQNSRVLTSYDKLMLIVHAKQIELGKDIQITPNYNTVFNAALSEGTKIEKGE